MAYHQDIGEWHGKTLVDRDGERIGKLEDVYVDVETNEPMFGTVKEGLIGRHLTFVPLAGITIGPDNLQVTISKELVKSAPDTELHGDERCPAEESTLYRHYQLNYTPSRLVVFVAAGGLDCSLQAPSTLAQPISMDTGKPSCPMRRRCRKCE